LTDAVPVRVGAENVFDAYPDEAVFQASCGLVYSRKAPCDTDAVSIMSAWTSASRTGRVG